MLNIQKLFTKILTCLDCLTRPSSGNGSPMFKYALHQDPRSLFYNISSAYSSIKGKGKQQIDQ